jgi:hypothetical protein
LYRRGALAVAALVAVSCAGTPSGSRPYTAWAPRVAGPPGLEDSPPRTARSVRLTFELDGRPFPLPLVHGSVGGEPTWMLVDTGTNSHVLAGWLARRLGYKAAARGDVGTDHAGHEISTTRVEHASVTIDGWGTLADGPILVAEIPSPIEKLGIGVFLSPQSLAEGASVVLDLPGREMHLASYSSAEKELRARGRAITPEGGLACVDDEGSIRGLAYVIPAEVARERVMLLVDSGAERTDVFAESKVGRTLLPRSAPNKEQMYAASGRIQTRTVRKVPVSLGGWSGQADVDIIPGTSDPYCPRDGVVSMDVLSSCVLVLGPGRMTGFCAL